MPDGSVFKIKEMQEKALRMKLEGEGITEEQAKEAFIPEVVKHWKDKTIPTKFGFDESWKDSEDVTKPPKDMADLSDFVIYPKIRSAMMGLMFAELSKIDGKKSKEAKVVAINDEGGATVYGSNGKVERHKNLESALPDNTIKKKKRRDNGTRIC